MLRRLIGLGPMSDELAWELVTPLFRLRTSMVWCVLILLAVGLAGFFGSGSPLFLLCVGKTAIVILWRIHQVARYARNRHAHSPAGWAQRGLLSGWALGLSWGIWSVVVPFETRPGLIIIVLGVHAALVTGEAVRNHSIPLIARGQVLLASVPLSLACLLSPDLFLNLYAGLIALNALITIRLVDDLHREKLRTLLNEVHAVELSSKLAAANEELELVNQHLKELVATDPLTGLLNRRALDLAAARAWRAAVREEQPISVLMVDIDHFKRFNDHYGHQAGDECLCKVAEILSRASLRPDDLVARYGGEEFIAVLPGTDLAGASMIANRILIALNMHGLAHALTSAGHVTVSIGLAATVGAPSMSLHGLIEQADRALYVAKRAGRNCAHAHAAVPPALPPTPANDEIFMFNEEDGVAGGPVDPSRGQLPTG